MEWFLTLDLLSLEAWKDELDLVDCALIAFIKDMQAAESEKVKEQKQGEYIWLSFSYLIEQVPFLHIGERQIRRKLENLEKLNLLARKRIRVRGKYRGYYKLSKQYWEYREMQKKKISKDVDVRRKNKNTSSTDMRDRDSTDMSDRSLRTSMSDNPNTINSKINNPKSTSLSAKASTPQADGEGKNPSDFPLHPPEEEKLYKKGELVKAFNQIIKRA